MKFWVTIFGVFALFEMFHSFMETTLRHYESDVPGQKEHINFDKLRVKKINRTHHAFLGEMELFEEFGDKYIVSSIVWKMAGNEYKLMPFKLGPDPWCKFLEKYPEIFQHFSPPVTDFPPEGDVSDFELSSNAF